MSNVAPEPGEPRRVGEPSEWFKWVISKQAAVPTRTATQINMPVVSGDEGVPQMGEPRRAGEPSEWFKWATSEQTALPTSAATHVRATDASPKRQAEKTLRKHSGTPPTKPKYKSLRVSDLRDLRAKASQSKKEKRKLASEVKSRLPTDHDCPYCGSALDADKHADHIHPISKGGLSSEANMVWVCSECNLRKRSMTLAAFIKKFQLDRNAIEARLESLGKDF